MENLQKLFEKSILLKMTSIMQLLSMLNFTFNSSLKEFLNYFNLLLFKLSVLANQFKMLIYLIEKQFVMEHTTRHSRLLEIICRVIFYVPCDWLKINQSRAIISTSAIQPHVHAFFKLTLLFPFWHQRCNMESWLLVKQATR